jgi:hypothetical protein
VPFYWTFLILVLFISLFFFFIFRASSADDDVKFTSYNALFCFKLFQVSTSRCFCSQNSDDVKYITSSLKVV